MKLSQTENRLAVAAAKAGMDEKTARKWRRLGHLPSKPREPRQYRTRLDPFAGVWGEVEQLLERDASVEAKTIFDYLCRKDPEQFQEVQLRTLQRRVKQWRAQKGEPREVYFPQEHVPGRQAQSDFTHMNELLVTIAGQLFNHLLYHLTLTYSNWEWGQVCFSESYESLAEGVQDALWELGGVPQEHRTDSLSAAVRPPRSKEEFTEKYQGLLQHYGMKASHSSPGRGHENGDVEQSHHRFKRAVQQELILRGSREFAGRAEYEEFLAALFRRRNQLRRARVAAELKVLGELPKRQLEACSKEVQRVSRNATISIRNNYYSVPSQLIGERVELRIYGGHLEVWYGGELAERLERMRGEGHAAINYRHIIHSLVKKPGAFAHYRFQSSLFPRLIFRVAYDELQRQQPAQAEREYIQLLKLAAEESEELVAAVLRELIDGGEPLSSSRVREELRARVEQPQQVLTVKIEAVALQSYDQLLGQLLDSEEVAA
jgi:ribosomal protein S21